MDIKLQFCEDEDEVFFGSVTSKEHRKASKYSHRRTALFDSNFRRDRRLMRYTMDHLSMMSLNHPKVVLGSEGSELCESPLGSAASIDSPLGSETGTAPGEESPLVNGWLEPVGLGALMAEYEKSLGENTTVCNEYRKLNQIHGVNVCDDVSPKEKQSHPMESNNDVEQSEQSPGNVDQSEQSPDNVDQSEQSSDNVDQSEQSPNNLDQSQINGDQCVASNCISQSPNGSDCNYDCNKVADDCAGQLQGITADVANMDQTTPSMQSQYTETNGSLSHSVSSETQSNLASQLELCTVSQSDSGDIGQSEESYGSILAQSDISDSPLRISMACDLSSPQMILGDLSAIHTTTLADIFDQQCSTTRDQESHDELTPVPEVDLVIPSSSVSVSSEQEVPMMVTSSMIDPSLVSSQNDLVHDPNVVTNQGNSHGNVYIGNLEWTNEHDEDADVSIVTVGTVMEESIMDMSHRVYGYANDVGDSDVDASPQCHLVPDISEDLRSKALSRSGVIFTEKEFSPTLKVISSPHQSDEDTSPITMATNLQELRPRTLPLSPRGEVHSRLIQDPASPQCTYDHRPPDSPLSPADVKFTFLKESPRRGRVERLSPYKASSHTDPRPMGGVFDRLNSLEDIADTSDYDKPASNKKGTLRRAHSASKVRLNTASQLRIAARSQSGDHTSRKALHFGSSARQVNEHIKTTGTVNRQAISQVTSAELTPHRTKSGSIHTTPRQTTPRSATPRPTTQRAATPQQTSHRTTPATKSYSAGKPATNLSKSGSSVRSTAWAPPGGSPATRLPLGSRSMSASRTTPQRATSVRKPAVSPPRRVYKSGTPRYTSDLRPKPTYSDPVSTLDLDDSELDGSLRLDDSILIQEKRVELERLRAEKMRLQKRISRQTSEGSHQRSPLMPTTADNLPRVRVKDKQALSLSEPELDAITLVHTLCNSQQVVKLVSKQRATTVVRHNYDHKEASKIQWHEDLVTMVTDDGRLHSPKPSKPRRKSILLMRAPDNLFPYNDQPSSPIVVTKSSRKSLSYGKEPSPLINKGLY